MSMFTILIEGGMNDGEFSKKIYKYKIYGAEGEDRWEEVGQMEDGAGVGTETVVVPISMEKTMLDQCEATFHSASD